MSMHTFSGEEITPGGWTCWLEQNVPVKRSQVYAKTFYESLYRLAEAYNAMTGQEIPREVLRLKPHASGGHAG